MPVAQLFRQRLQPEQRTLLLAIVISLAIHLTTGGIWKIGQRLGWWRKTHFSLNLFKKPVARVLDAKNSSPPIQAPIQFTFVEVDPSDAAPPKETTLVGAFNTRAANPKPAGEIAPQFEGKKQDFLKVTPDAPLVPEKLPDAPAVKPDEIEAKVRKEKSEPQGETAPAKVASKPQDDKKGLLDNGPDTERQPKTRPRRLADVRGTPGPRMQQEGGVRETADMPSVDVKLTGFGQYDQEFISIVRARWFYWIEERNLRATGKVVITFRLNYDGRITALHMSDNEVGEIGGLICQKAILDPSPYRPWPADMRRELPADYCEMQITFRYLAP